MNDRTTAADVVQIFKSLNGLLKQEGEITAVEVKSSMTYHPSFEKTLRQLQDWIKTPVTKRAVVYAGEFENNGSDIKLLNYNSLNELP